MSLKYLLRQPIKSLYLEPGFAVML
jgi:hypothetical protein